nr:tigger transposable element-derived protein 1-like [Onthophagus taurus]
MESLHSTWIEEQNQRKVPLSRTNIQEKALSIYEELKSKSEHVHKDETFHASRGWFQKFKSRAKLHNVAAEDFKSVLKNIITQGGYSTKQVFNVDETGLYWKRLLKRTYISQQEKHAPGFKANKDRITLLLGANAAGDHRLKPLLINTIQNPTAMKNHQRNSLPVHWRWNKKGSMTAILFREWVSDIAVPELKNYCLKENFNSTKQRSRHPPDLDVICENIKFIFLPPNTTALIQPMDQGAISNFKAYYLRRTFKQLFHHLNDEISIKVVLKQINILKAVENVGESWIEVKQSCLKGVWRKLWPESTEDAEGADTDNLEGIVNDLVQYAEEVHFEGMEVNDIEDIILNQDEEEITCDELLQNFTAATEEATENSDTEDITEITNQKLAEACSLIDKAVEIFINHDKDENRSRTVMNAVAKDVQCYKDLYTTRKMNARQQTLDDFLKT